MCPLGVKWGHMKLWTEAHGLFSAELASPSCTREGVERRLVGEGRTAASSAMSQRGITQPESLTRQPLAASTVFSCFHLSGKYIFQPSPGCSA